ncbi:TPA: hypothetical protein HA318_00600, partial [Candidatus Micrarchaeota archaeon]|nr:hypothetical protein [Candidatus Micrarchaeota archaeon]
MFSKAKPATPDAPANGYSYVYGKPDASKQNACPLLPKTNCLYYKYDEEKQAYTQKVVCGAEAERPNVTKISPAPDRVETRIVTRNGKDYRDTVSTKCWNAKVSEWVKVEHKFSAPQFKLGANTVIPNENALFKGDIQKKTSQSTENRVDYRETVEYIEANEKNILAVGEAKEGLISSGKPFVISTLPYEATKEQLAKEQQGASMVYKIFGFLALAIGFYLILNPIAALASIGGAIPLIGGLFNALSGIVGIMIIIAAVIIAAIMTVILTIVFKVLRAITDNLLAVIAITIVVGLAAFYLLGMLGGSAA